MIEIFSLLTLILSITFHEFFHGLAAYRLGDSTAKNAGRLTLNPIKHLDPVGSFLLPLTLYLVNSPFLFGWAKPVPYNPNNLRDKRFGDAKVAVAGPLANLGLAIFAALLFRLLGPASALTYFLLQAIIINVLLALFNLIPLPPLDGSKILAVFLPARLRFRLLQANQWWGFLFLFLFLFIGFDYLIPLVFKISWGLAGLSL